MLVSNFKVIFNIPNLNKTIDSIEIDGIKMAYYENDEGIICIEFMDKTCYDIYIKVCSYNFRHYEYLDFEIKKMNIYEKNYVIELTEDNIITYA